jgi:DNA ligase-associated metallophosphoesterase
MSGDLAVTVAGERLVLLPERAVHWPRAATLLVADTHWGKAASFRAAGVFVPGGTTQDGVARLDAALDRTGARRLVVLGDYLHARTGRVAGTLDALAAWHARRPDLEQLLVRGNHDRHAGDPPPELGVRCVDAPLVEPPFALAHHPDPTPEGYVLAGHLHPGVRLTGPGRQRERLPCFWIGGAVMVLPAFGDFTGLLDVAPAAGDRVGVIAGDRVVEATGPLPSRASVR